MRKADRKMDVRRPVAWVLTGVCLFALMGGIFLLKDYIPADVLPLVLIMAFLVASSGCLLFLLPMTTRKKEPEKRVKAKVDHNLREFISASTSFAKSSTMEGVRDKIDQSLAIVADKTLRRSEAPIIPAGAGSFERYAKKCNACQACVTACPHHVLQPTMNIENLMLPQLKFDFDYCPVDCVKCNEVCPTGALERITAEEKTGIQIGLAVWLRKNCLASEGRLCDACEKVCPNGTIQMIKSGDTQFPVINASTCLGCGACSHACPAQPISALYIEGFKEHRRR